MRCRFKLLFYCWFLLLVFLPATLSAEQMVSVSQTWLINIVERLQQLDQNQIELGKLSSELQQRETALRKRSEQQVITLTDLRIRLQQTDQSLIDASKHIERLTESHEILETSRETLSQTFTEYREDRIQTEQQMLRRVQIERWSHRAIIMTLFGLLAWQTIN